MSKPLLIVLTAMAMLAFAGNSLLCRLALRQTRIDAASFTSIRIISGAAALWLLLKIRDRNGKGAGNWPSALALFGYGVLLCLPGPLRRDRRIAPFRAV